MIFQDRLSGTNPSFPDEFVEEKLGFPERSLFYPVMENS